MGRGRPALAPPRGPMDALGSGEARREDCSGMELRLVDRTVELPAIVEPTVEGGREWTPGR